MFLVLTIIIEQPNIIFRVFRYPKLHVLENLLKHRYFNHPLKPSVKHFPLKMGMSVQFIALFQSKKLITKKKKLKLISL